MRVNVSSENSAQVKLVIIHNFKVLAPLQVLIPLSITLNPTNLVQLLHLGITMTNDWSSLLDGMCGDPAGQFNLNWGGEFPSGQH